MKLYIVSSALVLLSLSSVAPFASAELTGRNRRLRGGEASAVTANDIAEDSTQFYYTPSWQRENGTPYWERANGTPWWERDNGRSWSSGWNYDPPVLDAMVSEYDIEAIAYGDYGRDEGEEYGDYENNPGFRHRHQNQGYGNEGDVYGRSSYERNQGYKQYKNIMNNRGFPEAEELVAVSSSYGPRSYRNNEGYKHRAHHYGGDGGGHSGHHGGGRRIAAGDSATIDCSGGTTNAKCCILGEFEKITQLNGDMTIGGTGDCDGITFTGGMLDNCTTEGGCNIDCDAGCTLESESEDGDYEFAVM